jgi:probable phosphoglycerate mutase
MFEIYLIRPGATDFDVQGRIQGTLDVPLSEQGQRQVEAMIEQLRERRIDAVYTSPHQAAEETGKALAEAVGLKCKPLKLLENVNLGLWQGMLVDQVRTKQPRVYRMWQDHPESVCPPEGEMLAVVRERVGEAISKLTKKHKEGAIAVVAPQPLAKIFAQALTRDASPCDLWKISDCGSWEAFVVLPAAPVSGA